MLGYMFIISIVICYITSNVLQNMYRELIFKNEVIISGIIAGSLFFIGCIVGQFI